MKSTQSLDTEILRSFVAIAEAGTFTAAAHQVYRSPSALSMQIKSLEDTLGHALFIRQPRRVRLTHHGELLLSYARRLLSLNAEAIAHFHAPSVSGEIRLGLPDDLGRGVLPQALGELARRYPDVVVNVTATGSAGLQQALDRGTLDLALVTAGQDGPAIAPECIVSREPMCWAGLADGLAAMRRPLPVALAREGCPWRRAAIAALDDAGLAYRLAYASETGLGQSAAARADLAVAALPRRLLADGLVAVPDLPPPRDTFIALLTGPTPGEATRILATALRRAFGG